tara:strand:- start:2499 stop:2849 length:351 start_codon:yes stop_codon:yes gene_type:complete
MPKRGEYKQEATADSKRQRRYNGSEEQKKRRASRNAAHRKAGDESGDDVDHKDGNPMNNSDGNLRSRSVKANRADNKSRRKPGAIFGKKASSKKVSTFEDLTSKGGAAIAKARKKK